MDMTAPKRQLLQHGVYIFGLLFLSAILGIIVSVTTNYFVSTVKWFSSLRTESIDFFQFNDFSIAPILWLFLAVFILHYVRKWCDITRWHGPSDAVYASHRTDNELDLKRGAWVHICGTCITVWWSASWSIWATRKLWRKHCQLFFADYQN